MYFLIIFHINVLQFWFFNFFNKIWQFLWNMKAAFGRPLKLAPTCEARVCLPPGPALDVGCRLQEAKIDNCTERLEGETPASTFDRWFCSYVANKACIAGRRAGDQFAGGIRAAGSASWIVSCPAAFAFPRALRGILVKSLLSKQTRTRYDCEVKSSYWIRLPLVSKKKVRGRITMIIETKQNSIDYLENNFLTLTFKINFLQNYLWVRITHNSFEIFSRSTIFFFGIFIIIVKTLTM